VALLDQQCFSLGTQVRRESALLPKKNEHPGVLPSIIKGGEHHSGALPGADLQRRGAL